ncbi:MAG: cupin domain-containing protein [Gemmatimonadaceae bacterium]
MSDLDLNQFVEHHEGISVIRSGETVRAWNGIQYQAGLSGKNTNAKQLSMNIATVPPGAVAFAHVHVGFEVMLYILEGHVRHEYGDLLKKSIVNGPGDFIFIEPGVPHEVFNLSDTEPVVAVVSRSDATEWAHIVKYDRGTGALGEVLKP